MADNHVHGGKDLQSPKDLYEFLINREVENIRFKWIDESDSNVFNEMLPPSVPKVPGILRTHQILSFSPEEIYYRDLSCFCRYPEMCKCFTPTKMRLGNANSDQLHPMRIQETYPDSPSTAEDREEHPKRIQETYPDSPSADEDREEHPKRIQETYPDSPSEDSDSEQYTVGKFVIVNYDNKPFVGQITKLDADNVEINCMVQHGNRNVFKWPDNPDYFLPQRPNHQHHLRARAPPQRAAQLTK